jgi:hypothetical protein
MDSEITPEQAPEVQSNGNGAATEPKVGRCEQCEFGVLLDQCVERAGKRYHLAAIHPGKPGRGMRQCGPVAVAWIYWLTWVTRLPGQPEVTESGAVSFDAPITNPLQLASATTELASVERAKVKAVDRESGVALMGAPDPVVRVIGWQLLRAV